MYQSPSVPLSIGGVLDHGFRLLKAIFTKVVGLAFISVFITSIPSLMMPQPGLGAEPSFPPGFLAVSLITGLIAVVFYGAIIARIDAVVKGQELTFSGAIGVGMSRFFPLIFCFILYGIAFMLGSLALLIPGLILLLSLSFAPYLVITDKLGPVEALKQSHGLVWGNWWRTATILTVVMFVLLAAYFLIGVVSGVGAFMGDPDVQTATLVGTIVMTLLSAVLTPVMYAFGMAILHDLKLRKEGQDLADRIEAIAAA